MGSVAFLQRVSMLVALVALGLALVLLGWRIYDQVLDPPPCFEITRIDKDYASS